MTAYLISDEGNISIVLKGKQYFVNSIHEAHAQVMEAFMQERQKMKFGGTDKAAVADYLEDQRFRSKWMLCIMEKPCIIL